MRIKMIAQDVIDAFDRGENPDVPIHPAAEIFPLLPRKELEDLAEDIKNRGLKEAVVLHPDGSVLDGRNRLRACALAGRIPRFKLWEGRTGEEVGYVLSTNLRRRHLNGSQLSMVAAKLTKLPQGRPDKSANLPEITQSEAAAALKVSVRNVRKARKIDDDAPDNIKRLVHQGMLKVAYAVARASADEKERIAAMGDDEALAEAKRIARNARLVGNEKPTATMRTEAALAVFLLLWRKAAEEDRTKVINWVQRSSSAHEALRSLILELDVTARASLWVAS
jgi:hypothetical protein